MKRLTKNAESKGILLSMSNSIIDKYGRTMKYSRKRRGAKSMRIRSEVEEVLKKTDARLINYMESTNDTYIVTVHFKDEEHDVTFSIHSANDTVHVELESHQDVTIAKFLRDNLEQQLNKH
jgi:ribosome-associated translation inhibitor RaiA